MQQQEITTLVVQVYAGGVCDRVYPLNVHCSAGFHWCSPMGEIAFPDRAISTRAVVASSSEAVHLNPSYSLVWLRCSSRI